MTDANKPAKERASVDFGDTFGESARGCMVCVTHGNARDQARANKKDDSSPALETRCRALFF